MKNSEKHICFKIISQLLFFIKKNNNSNSRVYNSIIDNILILGKICQHSTINIPATYQQSNYDGNMLFHLPAMADRPQV